MLHRNSKVFRFIVTVLRILVFVLLFFSLVESTYGTIAAQSELQHTLIPGYFNYILVH